MPPFGPFAVLSLLKVIFAGCRPFVIVSRLPSPRVASRRTTRAYTSYSGTPHVKFGRRQNKFKARARFVPETDWPRTLCVERVPCFTIADDVQNLFEEPNFPV
jgi:hypothetical protein